MADRNTWRLAGGIVAGPLFLLVWLAQALTRDGFDPAYHPLSLLSLGDLGWIQIANFVVTGLLYVACAAGLRHALRGEPGGTWGPALVAVQGIGLIMAGVFVTDAGAGFPPGAPEGAPERISWHGMLHEAGYILGSVSWLVLCVVFARRFAAGREWGWLGLSAGAPVAVVVLTAWPSLDSLSVRLVAATAISFGVVAAWSAQVLRRPARPGHEPRASGRLRRG